MQFATIVIFNMFNFQHVQFSTHAIFNTCNLQHVQFATHKGLEVGEIIPFPVYITPFLVLKISFEHLDINEKHFVEEVF